MLNDFEPAMPYSSPRERSPEVKKKMKTSDFSGTKKKQVNFLLVMLNIGDIIVKHESHLFVSQQVYYYDAKISLNKVPWQIK